MKEGAGSVLEREWRVVLERLIRCFRVVRVVWRSGIDVIH